MTMPLRRFLFLAIATACLAAPAHAQTPPDSARTQLDRAERNWLAAYHHNDPDAMRQFLADGFTITFPDGSVESKDDVVAGLDPSEGFEDGPMHYTEDRTIRVMGRTAILTGVYVSPGDEGEPDDRYRYTDTWMWMDGRWQVVASHLSNAKP
jgi:hypothetical protein